MFGQSSDSSKDSGGLLSYLSGSGEQEPITFETTKILPFSQKNFYDVVRNVNDYQNFVQYMTKSEIFENTHKRSVKNGVKKGKFDAETTIGFQVVSFAYISKVTYKEPYYVLSVSGKQAEGSVSSKIFSELYSLWEIE